MGVIALVWVDVAILYRTPKIFAYHVQEYLTFCKLYGQITHEYGRRLIFELQQQEQLLEKQHQQQLQQQQQQMQDLLDDKWKQQQQMKDLREQLATLEHRKSAVEAEAQVLQQETEVSIRYITALTAFLSQCIYTEMPGIGRVHILMRFY